MHVVRIFSCIFFCQGVEKHDGLICVGLWVVIHVQWGKHRGLGRLATLHNIPLCCDGLEEVGDMIIENVS